MAKKLSVGMLGLLVAMGVWLVATTAAPTQAQDIAPAQTEASDPQPVDGPLNECGDQGALVDPAMGPICNLGYCKVQAGPGEPGLFCAFSGTGPAGCCNFNDCFESDCSPDELCPPNACANGCGGD